jgi:hypothetical protein
MQLGLANNYIGRILTRYIRAICLPHSKFPSRDDWRATLYPAFCSSESTFRYIASSPVDLCAEILTAGELHQFAARIYYVQRWW